MKAILVGPDGDGLGAALSSAGVEVTAVDGIPTADRLVEAGIERADLYVLTDPDEASTIPVAREHNAGVRVVLYAAGSLPEYARGQADLAVDPALLGPEAVAEELARDGTDAVGA